MWITHRDPERSIGLLKLQEIRKVMPLNTLYITRSIALCRDLFNSTNEKITARKKLPYMHLTVRRNEQTPHVLTFNRSTLQEMIRARIHRLSVTDYIP